MRIATLQFSARLGKVEGNIRRADELLSAGLKRIKGSGGGRRPLDLLVLPEMAFSGYNFSSLNTIKPYLEPTEAGPTAEWARSAARRLGCVVCVGYPELRSGLSSPRPDGTSPTSEKVTQSHESRFNSMLIVDSEGSTLLNYQKRFLYYTDETWAAEGENGKGRISLPISKRGSGPDSCSSAEPPLQQQPVISTAQDGTSPNVGSDRHTDGATTATTTTTTTTVPTVVGICMDINPYRFLAPYSAFEFATHVLDSGAKLVILSMAWLTQLMPDEVRAEATEPDMDTFRYWIGRFWPFVSGGRWDGGEIVVVFANRCGEEEGVEDKDDATYAGTSCVMTIRRPERRKGGRRRDNDAGVAMDEESEACADPYDAEIAVWDMLGRGEDGVCFADTDSEPRMIFRLERRQPG